MSHMYGVRSFGSVPTCSGWGFSTHRAFSSAQDDDTRRRKGSYLGDTLHVLELAVLYYDTSSPLEKGRAKGAGWICPAGAFFYVADNVLLAGIVSHMWHEILRLSPHLFWLGLFTHRAFSSAQDDDTRGRKGSHLGDILRVLELSVLYTIRVGPWRRAAPKAQDGSTRWCEKLCETTCFP